jgi:hypothetical protein
LNTNQYTQQQLYNQNQYTQQQQVNTNQYTQQQLNTNQLTQQQYNPYQQQQVYVQPTTNYQQTTLQTNSYQPNVFSNTTVVSTTTNKFNPNCHKCHGTGFKKPGKPCKRCCLRAHVCPKCGGSGWNSKKGKACSVCYYFKNGGTCPICMGSLKNKKGKPCSICVVKIINK